MYLKTIFELEEEGIVPLRARIAERLHQSGPTVSQTVARMERDGLLTVEGDRHLAFTDRGAKRAMRVMRKHRLAERLLVDVIGLDWEQVHTEACRWEHVMSETVERRLDGLGHDVLPPAGLRVHLLPVEPDHVDQQPLGEPVLAHHAHRPFGAAVGERQVTVTLDGQQAVALHPRDGLAHGGARLVKPLGDARTQRHDALFFELEDRLEVHLGRVDQIRHAPSTLSPGTYARHYPAVRRS